MRRNGIPTGRLIVAVVLGIGTLLFGASTASAHTVTVACTGTGSGLWSIVNSDGQAMSFTATGATPSSGTIAAFGSTTVSFSGTSLTVEGTWDDGFTGSSTGTGECEVTDTTTTTTTTSTTTTTTPTTTTTIPETTSTTTTLPCEFDPLLPPDDPGCAETTTTTTQPPGTTTPPAVLDIGALGPVCLKDAPYIDLTFGNNSQFNGMTATVTFIDVNGNTVGTESATYQAGSTVRFVYPGASVDANGNPLDWPGWMFDGDEWVPDPSDAHLRVGLTVVVEVNPTASGTVSYPPATAACNAGPDDPPGELPPTR
jgi:hypothetical protein